MLFIWELEKLSPPGYQSQYSKNDRQTRFILRFLHAFDGNECVIVYYLVKWCLGSKIGRSLLNGNGLCPLLLQLHHSMFSFLWGFRCTQRWIKGIP